MRVSAKKKVRGGWSHPERFISQSFLKSGELVKIEGYVFGSGSGKGTRFQEWVGSLLFMEGACLFSWWTFTIPNLIRLTIWGSGSRWWVVVNGELRKGRLMQLCSRGRQTKLNVAGVRESVTANRCRTVQLNKPQGLLPPWGGEATSSFCSIPGGTLGPFWLDWEGRWSLLFFQGSLTCLLQRIPRA